MHDSKLFHTILDEIFGVIAGFTESDKQLTVVFDKGMNSAENISFIDAHQQIHFVTTYSLYNAEYEAKRDPESFDVLDTPKNRELTAEKKRRRLPPGFSDNHYSLGQGTDPGHHL